ncbi:MAG TPA: DUF4231 domain-containing protein [Actinophytocola sp.]|jgi:hypothetical protein|uniref:DUF4231 domain-containing protein n=1 Tax=Actinophytocola sp. TaxID=1872138 RepID=UPI002F9556E4
MTDETPGPAPAGLTPSRRAELLRRWIAEAIAYSRRKRRGFRAAASLVKIATLVLSAASTIILGVQDLDLWTGIGFALVATVTVVSAVEPFFNWRSRWVLMEEQQHRLHRLDEDLTMLVARTPAGGMTDAMVDEFYEAYREVWNSTSQRWLEFRKSAEQG